MEAQWRCEDGAQRARIVADPPPRDVAGGHGKCIEQVDQNLLLGRRADSLAAGQIGGASEQTAGAGEAGHGCSHAFGCSLTLTLSHNRPCASRPGDECAAA